MVSNACLAGSLLHQSWFDCWFFALIAIVNWDAKLALIYFLMLVLVVIFDSRLIALVSLMFPMLHFGYAVFLHFKPAAVLATSDL